MRKETLVIYGGSFDPIHNGHLRIARRAREHFQSDVVFVPAYAPRWKKPAASFNERLLMLRLALKSEGSPSFRLSTVEGERKGEVSYSIDTVEEFARLYPSRRLVFLIGADEANSFPKWKEAERLARLADVYYVPREGVEIEPSLFESFGLRRLLGADPGTVSSSAVRSLTSLDLPFAVLNFIVEHGLYFMEELRARLGEERLAHSVSVASLAYSIALQNGIASPERAYVAGLLHDIGKPVGEVSARDIVLRECPEAVDYPPYALHQWVGSFLARERYGIKDGEILDAIAYHCTGKPHMTPLGKIVYSADKIEPGRGYDSRKLIKSCLANYYVGFLDVLKANRIYLKKNGSGIDNELTAKTMALYLRKEK